MMEQTAMTKAGKMMGNCPIKVDLLTLTGRAVT